MDDLTNLKYKATERYKFNWTDVRATFGFGRAALSEYELLRPGIQALRGMYGISTEVALNLAEVQLDHPLSQVTRDAFLMEKEDAQIK